ncbi:hypothetical protein ZWY2020_033863 [Hordeum vulgare]|nr:hypothetical protein ZWY2020_033863 [Hordeum vulgare]
MDPKVLLDFINVWYEDPNTPIDDLKLPPGVSHMVATFINEAKWKEQKAKQAKIAKARKEKFLRQNVLKLTPEALVSTQQKQPKDASPVEEEIPQAEEQYQEHRADEPAIEEIITETAPDETATDRAASPKQADDYVPAGSSLPAEESVKNTPSPKTSKVKKLIPSASDAKKTRAAEKEAKKRKASSAEEKVEAKRLKEIEESAPLDPVPLNVAPSFEMVVVGDHTTRADEEMKDAASEEHTDEEIQIDDSPQPHIPRRDY